MTIWPLNYNFISYSNNKRSIVEIPLAMFHSKVEMVSVACKRAHYASLTSSSSLYRLTNISSNDLHRKLLITIHLHDAKFHFRSQLNFIFQILHMFLLWSRKKRYIVAVFARIFPSIGNVCGKETKKWLMAQEWLVMSVTAWEESIWNKKWWWWCVFTVTRLTHSAKCDPCHTRPKPNWALIDRLHVFQ